MLVTTNHLLFIFHVPQWGLQEDLLHDLAWHRGETDCSSLDHFFSLLEKGAMFPLLQSVGKLHGLSSMCV